MASKTNQQANIDVTVNGTQASKTVKQMEADVRRLRSVWRNAEVGSEEYLKAVEDLRKANAVLKEHRDHLKEAESAWVSIVDVLKQSIPYLAGDFISQAFTDVKVAVKDTISAQREMESSLANLKGITGATQKEMRFYRTAAKETALATGVMAKDVVESYKLIGGAKPELLENKEALTAITKEAIILSQATGMELPEAASRLTDVLNQFNAPAGKAKDYVNILAEASKLGAAEVPDLSDAVLKSGSAARSANVNIAETSAVLEAFADKGLKGAEAGTQLRNVFLKLTTAEALPQEALDRLAAAGVDIKILSDTTLPLKARLEELSKIQGNAAAISKVFGTENFNAASIIIDSRKKIDELSVALGKNGLSTAYEQAAENLDTIEGAEARWNATLNVTLLGEGKIGNYYKALVNGATAFLVAMQGAPEFFKEYQIVIYALISTYISLNAVKLKSIAISVIEQVTLQKGMGLRIKDNVLAGIALIKEEALTAAKTKSSVAGMVLAGSLGAIRAAYILLLGPVGLAIAAFSALVVAIMSYDKYNQTAQKNEVEKIKVMGRAKIATSDLEHSYKKMENTMANINKLSVQERKDLQDKITKTISLAEAELALLEVKEKQVIADNTRVGLGGQILNILKNGGQGAYVAAANIKDGLENGAKAGAEVAEKLDTMREKIQALKGQEIDLNKIVNAEKIADAMPVETLAQMDEKLQGYNFALKNAVAGGKEFQNIQQKIAALEKNIKLATPKIATTDELDKAKKDYDDLQKEIKQAQRKVEIESMQGMEKEVAMSIDKWAVLIEKAKGHNRELLILEQLKNAEISKIQDDFFKEQADKEAVMHREYLKREEDRDLETRKLKRDNEAKLRKTLADADSTDYERKKREIEDRWNEEMEKALDNADLVLQVQKAKAAELAKFKQEQERSVMAIIDDFRMKDDQKAEKEINDKYDAALEKVADNCDLQLEIEKARVDELAEYKEQKERETNKKIVDYLSDQTQVAADAYNQIMASKRDKALSDDLSALDKRREKELENFAGTEGQKKQIEDSYRQQESDIKRKAFEKDKKAAVIQAIINGALAVGKALPNIPLAIAAGISAGAQLAVIQNSATPEFADGGFTPQSASNKTAVGIVHANEYVISAPDLKDPYVFNFAKALEARKRGFESGGFTTPMPAPMQIPITTGAAPTPQALNDPGNQLMIQVLQKISSKLDTPFRAFVVIGNQEADQIEELMLENNDIKSDVTL